MDRVRVASTDEERADALAVRRTVFVEEQGVPESLELDDHDETATHFVAYDDGEAVGAARLRGVDEGTAKVERVSVLAERRREGWGDRLMDAVERQAGEAGYGCLRLHSQTEAAPFYDRRGYERHGEVFYEAGIPHVEMSKPL